VTEQRDGRTLLIVKEGRLDAHNSGELKDRILSFSKKAAVISWWISATCSLSTVRD